MGKVKFGSFNLIKIKQFYTVTELDGKTLTFNKLKEIAEHYKSTILKIHHICEKQTFDEFKVEREPFPYIYEFENDEYESENAQDIVRVTGISKTHVGHLVKKYRENLDTKDAEV